MLQGEPILWCLRARDMYGPGVSRGLLETCMVFNLILQHYFHASFTFITCCMLLICVPCRKQFFIPVWVQGLEKVRLIAVGAFHNLAFQEDGTLWAWAKNEYGQLGTGDTQTRLQPIPVKGLSGLTLVCIKWLNPCFLFFKFLFLVFYQYYHLKQACI